jgi:hypothetical protein
MLKSVRRQLLWPKSPKASAERVVKDIRLFRRKGINDRTPEFWEFV